MAKDYDYLLKVLLVGDSDVGKHEILSGLEDASSESPFCSGNGKKIQSIFRCKKFFHFQLTKQLYYWKANVSNYNFGTRQDKVVFALLYAHTQEVPKE